MTDLLTYTIGYILSGFPAIIMGAFIAHQIQRVKTEGITNNWSIGAKAAHQWKEQNTTQENTQ